MRRIIFKRPAVIAASVYLLSTLLVTSCRTAGPADTVEAFLRACESGNYEFARSYITLRTPSTGSEIDGEEEMWQRTMEGLGREDLVSHAKIDSEVKDDEATVFVSDERVKNRSRDNVFYLYRIDGLWKIKSVTSGDLHDLTVEVNRSLER